MSALTRRLAAEIESMNAAFERLDAVRVEPDGFRWIDETRVPPELAAAYRRACSMAYALGVAT